MTDYTPPTERNFDEIPLSYNMYNQLDIENISNAPAEIANITKQIGETALIQWRNMGGCWMLQAEWKGEDWEKEEMFIDGLMREVRVSLGGEERFRGFVGKMVLKRPTGEVYIRDWTELYNRYKSIYTRLGDNQFTNGSAESGVWSSYGSPPTLEVSTAWFTDGVQSVHIVTDDYDQGAIIQTGITIVANKAYQINVKVNIIEGDWFLEVYRTDTGDTLAKRGEDTLGEIVMSVSISEDNEYAGNVGVRLYTDDASPQTAEIYADEAVFQDAPYQAVTNWYEDTLSQVEFGTKENILLLAACSSETAQDKAVTELRKTAWAHILPPTQFQSVRPQETSLDIVVLGYIFTANNTHSETKGTDTISDHLAALIAQTEFLTEGHIDANTRNYQIEDRYPQKIWDIIEDIILSGDSSGNRYRCGVFSEREFSYEVLEDTYRYIQNDGKIFELDNTEAEPWRVEPGYMFLKDMPLGPGQSSGYEVDDPRVVFMDEVIFDAKDWLDGGLGVKWRTEQRG